MEASGIMLGVVGGLALLTALVPLLREALRAAFGRPRLPLPSTRQSYRFARLTGGPLRRWAEGSDGEVTTLPVARVERLVLIASADEHDPHFFTFTIMGRHDDNLAILSDGHCLFSELPLVLSSSLPAWERWIADPGSVAGVTSL